MTWTKSDGQLTSTDPLDLISETNQLKSCTIPGDDITLKFNVDAKDNGAFTIRVTYDGYPASVIYAEEKLEFTDNNGSYRYGMYIYNYNQVVSASYIEEKFDDHGNSILQEEWETSEENMYAENSKTGAVLVEGIKHEYKYDGPHGEMTEDIESDYDSDEDAYLPYMKVTYDSFVDATVTAIKGINDNANEPATFYNLQGMKVNGNAKGLYIMKQGSKTVKIMK